VPRTPQEALFDRALAEGAALVGTGVVDGPVLAVVVGHTHRGPVAGDGFDPPLGEFVRIERLVPVDLSVPGLVRHRAVQSQVGKITIATRTPILGASSAGSFVDRSRGGGTVRRLPVGSTPDVAPPSVYAADDLARFFANDRLALTSSRASSPRPVERAREPTHRRPEAGIGEPTFTTERTVFHIERRRGRPKTERRYRLDRSSRPTRRRGDSRQLRLRK
jgi:hypothetical protein